MSPAVMVDMSPPNLSVLAGYISTRDFCTHALIYLELAYSVRLLLLRFGLYVSKL